LGLRGIIWESGNLKKDESELFTTDSVALKHVAYRSKTLLRISLSGFYWWMN
jgi:hypothetical protein